MSTTTITTGVRIVRDAETERSKQGLLNRSAISAETVGARGLWMGTITVPPGGRANAHLHEDHETAIFALQGAGEVWYGELLQECATFQAGDFIYIGYIGAGVPHVPVNTSPTEPMIAIAARTDPDEQESVVLLPYLDKMVAG